MKNYYKRILNVLAGGNQSVLYCGKNQLHLSGWRSIIMTLQGNECRRLSVTIYEFGIILFKKYIVFEYSKFDSSHILGHIPFLEHEVIYEINYL